MAWLKAALGFAASAYVKDVVVRPRQVAQLARSYCDRVRKPLLQVGAGTPGSSIATALFGPTLVGDVNLDIAAPAGVPGRGRVVYGDAQDLSAWPDGSFGAVFASHVLEHVDRPDLALSEWRRVADKAFIVVPQWWCPHTWLHPGHRWFIDSKVERAYPLWNGRRYVYLLDVSDSRYAAGR